MKYIKVVTYDPIYGRAGNPWLLVVGEDGETIIDRKEIKDKYPQKRKFQWTNDHKKVCQTAKFITSIIDFAKDYRTKEYSLRAPFINIEEVTEEKVKSYSFV